MKQFRLLVAAASCTFHFIQANGQMYYNHITEVMSTHQLEPGSYATARDFFYNFPSTSDSITVTFEPRDKEPWIGTFKVKPRYASTGKPVRGCWGFSTGRQAFIFHQIEFFPIEMDQDGNLFFYGYDEIDRSGESTSAFLGGALGASIHASAAELKAMKRKVKYTITSTTGVPVLPVYADASDPAPVMREIVIFRPHNKETDTEVKFLLDEKYIYSFVPGSYVIKRYGPLENETSICLGEKFERCTAVTIPDNITKWFRLSFPEDSNEPVLEQLDDVDMFEYNKVANKQDRRGIQQPVEVLD
jgi:hypothetical protein